jgi:hypothetical protein
MPAEIVRWLQVFLKACRKPASPFDVKVHHRQSRGSTMRFAVLVKASKDSEAGILPTPDEFTKMGKFNEGLIKDGVMLAGDGFQPTSKGSRIRFDDGRTTVTDGPFTETKELVAGFWIVQAKSKQEVIERFVHAPFDGGNEIEIRPLYEAEDFGDNLPDFMKEMST